jgi:hypothetical protein
MSPSISRDEMRKHCNRTHDWRSSKGDREHWHSVWVQTFFKSAGLQMTISYNSYGNRRDIYPERSPYISWDKYPDVRRIASSSALSGITWRIASSNYSTPRCAHLCPSLLKLRSRRLYQSSPSILVCTVCLHLFKSSHYLSSLHPHPLPCLCISKSTLP